MQAFAAHTDAPVLGNRATNLTKMNNHNIHIFPDLELLSTEKLTTLFALRASVRCPSLIKWLMTLNSPQKSSPAYKPRVACRLPDHIIPSHYYHPC